jgi:transcriptional regulator with XRE-family HTH domain
MYDDQRVKIDKVKFQAWIAAEVSKSSQNRVAKELGTTHATINRYVHGKVDAVTGRQMNAIAVYRGESVQDTLRCFALPLPEVEPDPGDLGNRVATLEEKYEQLLSEVELLKEERELLSTEIGNLKEFVEVLIEELNEAKRSKGSRNKV